MNSEMILRSPALAGGGPVHVVRLCEMAPYASGGLAQVAKPGGLARVTRPAKPHAVTLHLSPSEFTQLQKKWGAPRSNAATRVSEYTFPAHSLRGMKHFADGGSTTPDYLRTRAANPVTDYTKYGFGPEAKFYNDNVVADPPKYAPPPTPPVPKAQSGSNTAADIAGFGTLLAGGAKLADVAGYGGALSQGAATLGNLASGNFIGAAKNGLGLYNKVTAPSMEDYASGAATNDALTQAGITGDLSGTAAGTTATPTSSAGSGNATTALNAAGNLVGAYQGIEQGGAAGYAQAANDVAGLAGYSIPALSYAGAVDQAAHGDIPGAAVSAISTYLPVAGIGFAAASLANKAFGGGKTFQRNSQQWLNDTGAQQITLGRNLPAIKLPDGTLLPAGAVKDLSAAYYSAAYEGGDPQKYLDALKALKPMTGFNPNAKAITAADTSKGNIYGKIPGHARGGALRLGSNYEAPPHRRPHHVRGPGTGRSDSIPAQLSDGEYVLTAEDVSLLGDGSNDAGAKVLDDMRTHLRKHKGAALAHGKISPNAKSPLQYMT